jgi:hypothetical protein
MHIDIAVMRKQPVNPTIPMKPLYWTRIIVPTSGQPASLANRCVVLLFPLCTLLQEVLKLGIIAQLFWGSQVVEESFE